MNVDADIERVVAATEAALQREGWAPMRVVLVAEVLNTDGDRMLIHGMSSGMPPWDVLGLLHHGLMVAEYDARDEAG